MSDAKLWTSFVDAEKQILILRELLREAREPVWIISTLREASVLQSRDRDRLKSLVARIDAFLAGVSRPASTAPTDST